jgi:hypothetical protein
MAARTAFTWPRVSGIAAVLAGRSGVGRRSFKDGSPGGESTLVGVLFRGDAMWAFQLAPTSSLSGITNGLHQARFTTYGWPEAGRHSCEIPGTLFVRW